MRIIGFFFIFLFSMVFSITSFAAKQSVVVADTPHQRVETATKQLLTLVTEAKDYYEKEPERYFRGIEGILDTLIDFSSFTRSVMGPYGTAEYFKSLKTKEERDAYKANYKRFVETFRGGLINTYGKGMLAFNGQQIEIVPATEEDKLLIEKKESVEVIQSIKGADDVYRVIYKLRFDKKGEWMLRNVSIGSVNVGSLYRDQFIAAMDKYENDFSKVIDNWVVEAQMEDTTLKTAQEKSTH